MYLLVTKSNHFFDIHLIPRWEPSPIQHIPSNEKDGNFNQLLQWIIHWQQRIVQIVFLHNILKVSDVADQLQMQNVSQAERENYDTRSIKTCRLPHSRNKSDKTKKMLYM